MPKAWKFRSALVTVSLLASLQAMPLRAQDEDYERIVIIMRACAEIEDVMARVTCYDNNIGPRRQASGITPGSARTDSPPAATANAAPAGFGAEMVRQPEAERRRGRQDNLAAEVSASREIEPGIYLLTLSDGAQWQFVDSAPLAYDPPRSGDRVELERGSLGSVFLEFADQRRLRVRRVR